MSADLDTIRRALEGAVRACRYHGETVDTLDFWFGEPRCESCRQPWRVRAALAALKRLDELLPQHLRQETEWARRQDNANGRSSWTSEPYYRREHAERYRTGDEQVVQRQVLAKPWEPAPTNGETA